MTLLTLLGVIDPDATIRLRADESSVYGERTIEYIGFPAVFKRVAQSANATVKEVNVYDEETLCIEVENLAKFSSVCGTPTNLYYKDVNGDWHIKSTDHFYYEW